MLSEVIDNLVDPYFQTIKLSRSCTRITCTYTYTLVKPLWLFSRIKTQPKKHTNKYICILTNRNPSPSNQLGLCLSFLHHLALLSQLVFFQGGSPVSSMAILQAHRIWEIRGIPLVKMQRLRLRPVRVDMKGCWVSKDVVLTKKQGCTTEVRYKINMKISLWSDFWYPKSVI